MRSSLGQIPPKLSGQAGIAKAVLDALQLNNLAQHTFLTNRTVETHFSNI